MNTTYDSQASEDLQGLELVSALADGQLAGPDADRAVRLALDDAAGRAAWDRYHLVGDVLRSADLALPAFASPAVSSGAGLVASVMRRIAAEPPREAPMPVQQVPVPSVLVATPAANDAWGWKLLAGCASVAAVAAIAWSLGAAPQQGAIQALAPNTAPAGAPAPAVATAEPEPVMIRDPRLDELLAAHRQFGGTSALHAPAGFLRNATFEAPKR